MLLGVRCPRRGGRLYPKKCFLEKRHGGPGWCFRRVEKQFLQRGKGEVSFHRRAVGKGMYPGKRKKNGSVPLEEGTTALEGKMGSTRSASLRWGTVSAHPALISGSPKNVTCHQILKLGRCSTYREKGGTTFLDHKREGILTRLLLRGSDKSCSLARGGEESQIARKKRENIATRKEKRERNRQ